MNPRPTSTPAVPRRDFLKSSATLAAGATIAASTPRFLSASEYKRSIGANDRIRIAQIGCGSRGKGAHLEKGILPHVKATNFEVVAIADPWKTSREGTNAVIKEAFGREAKAFVSYRDLLAMDGIDAVMIASPDHQHTTHLEAVITITVSKKLVSEVSPAVGKQVI